MALDKPRKPISGISFSKNKYSPKKYPPQNAPAWTEFWPDDPILGLAGLGLVV